MFYVPSHLRGSRQTKSYAVALAAVVLTGTAMVAVTIGWGLFVGLRGEAGESIELMAIDASAATTVAMAPSRPAPAAMLPFPITEEEIEIRESALVKATEDDGPALGQELPAVEPPAGETPTFDGRPLRAVKTMRMLTTAYSPDAQSCGIWADGITASGYSVWTNGMKLVAADTRLLPFGTIISVPGYHGGQPVPVLDRGGAIKGHRLDVLYPTHERALIWGVQRLDVTVWEYAD